jgi:hypothetical protein
MSVLVEFAPRPGSQQVGIFDKPKKDIEQKSQQAMDDAMTYIEKMAKKVGSMHDKIPMEFSKVEIAFGLKFDWDLGPIIAKAGTEASIDVTLTWSRP